MAARLSRRRLLIGTAGAMVGLSGCLHTGSSDDSDLYVSNDTKEIQSFTLTITNEETGDQVLETNFDLEPDDGKNFALDTAEYELRIVSEPHETKHLFFADGGVVLQLTLTQSGFKISEASGSF